MLVLQMKIKFMYENNCPLVIFLRLNGIAKLKNAKIKMLCFEAQIAKISNRRKYPLYGNFQTRRGWAFILHMCIPCDKTFQVVP